MIRNFHTSKVCLVPTPSDMRGSAVLFHFHSLCFLRNKANVKHVMCLVKEILDGKGRYSITMPKSNKIKFRMKFTGHIHDKAYRTVQKSLIASSLITSIVFHTKLIFLFIFQGAFTFRGKMIDKPLLLQAQNIVKLTQIMQKRT